VGEWIDLAVVGVLALAILRGLLNGVVREVFSLAALAAAVLAFRALRAPVAAEIAARTQWDPLIATAAAGGLVVIGALVFVTLTGAIVRRLVSAAGLTLVDRLGGAALGAVEGLLVVGLALFGATEVLGARDPLLAGSRAVEIFDAYVGTSPTRPTPRGDAMAHPVRSSSSAPPSDRGAGSAR
jgi:membrane protein required for colicin V production